MATDSQTAANRQNAQSSTGPRTETGKTASSHNALTLGLYTTADYVRPEERDLYEDFCQTMYTELSPVGLLEESPVSEIRGANWRLRRCATAEADLAGYTDSTDNARRSVERSRAHAHSILHRAVNQLRRLQTERACRLVLNAVGDDAGLADFREVLVAHNRNERGQNQAHNSALASICNDEIPAGNSMRSAPVSGPRTARNAACPCNSGEKYKRCCGKTAPPLLGKAA